MFLLSPEQAKALFPAERIQYLAERDHVWYSFFPKNPNTWRGAVNHFFRGLCIAHGVEDPDPPKELKVRFGK